MYNVARSSLEATLGSLLTLHPLAAHNVWGLNGFEITESVIPDHTKPLYPPLTPCTKRKKLSCSKGDVRAVAGITRPREVTVLTAESGRLAWIVFNCAEIEELETGNKSPRRPQYDHFLQFFNLWNSLEVLDLLRVLPAGAQSTLEALAKIRTSDQLKHILNNPLHSHSSSGDSCCASHLELRNLPCRKAGSGIQDHIEVEKDSDVGEIW
ncbi:hypothetical protein EV424DRAFT_1555788 [Suillus variegatus]|nr:hypothetical protein EV424DRAFT_1555788 [Suillus variegatus]